LGWTAAETTEVLAALARHADGPVRVEERIVHDANAVEVLGAFGTAKAFTTGGALGQSYEQAAAIYARSSSGGGA
jgi:enhancing lycopene biosynthesis protein 2